MAIKTLGAALRQINRLFSDGAITGLSDAELLDRFLLERDGAAFEMLMARHGPMVLNVCRGVLRNPADAEDAFQATFLVLVSKARTLRGRANLGGWLHLVAYRVAIQANAAAARRRVQEREAGEMTAAASMSNPVIGDELSRALHEEIARLPDKYRLPIVLCDLEGIPQTDAAGQLRWSERSLRRRLAEGRDRLKARLGRRGLAPQCSMLDAVFLLEARSAVPAALCESTARAALATIDHATATGVVSAAAYKLTREVLKMMLVQNLKLASATLLGVGLMTWATTAAIIRQGDKPPNPPSATTPVAKSSVRAPASSIEPDPLAANGTFPVRGLVLDPDGRPVAGAAIHVWRHYSEDGWNRTGPVAHGQRGRVAVSGPDSRFHFALDTSASDFPYFDYPVWQEAKIAAVAPGYGPAWIAAGSLPKGGEATLQLVHDDVPIRGRVVDPQGRPVAGVTVRAYRIAAVNAGIDPGSLIVAGQFQDDRATSHYTDPTWLGRQGTWTTDADGRFEVSGVGRDRIIELGLDGPGLAHLDVYVMARPSQTPPRIRQQPSGTSSEIMSMSGPGPAPPLYGATFELIIGPSKPIVGVVRIKGTGRPAAGITVRGIEPTTQTWVYATADQDGRFRILGLPKAGAYLLRTEARSGAEPYLNASLTLSDTEGLKPIETTMEVPRGVIITGRLIDQATGRPVRAKHVNYVKLPTNTNDGYPGTGHGGAVAPTFTMTVPPGVGLIYANVRGEEPPYTRARLRKDDKGKGIGGPGDGETLTVQLNSYHAYKIIDVPADAKDFRVDLELTRGLTRKGQVVDPAGKPVAGARCYGLEPLGFIKTLPDETFAVHGLEPGYPRQVIFTHKERRLVGAITIKDEDLESEALLEMRLGPPCSVKGRLVDEDGLPLAGAALSVMSYYGPGHFDSLPPGPDALWPDDETFTADSDGRFEVTGLKPGVRCLIGVHIKARPNTRIDTGQVFRNIVLERFGELRDVGDVKVKVTAE